MCRIKETLQKWGYNMCAVYLIDAQYSDDASKFISGSLTALSAMVRAASCVIICAHRRTQVQLELPHINVLTKVDLFLQRGRRAELERFLDLDTRDLIDALDGSTSAGFERLNTALANLVRVCTLTFPLLTAHWPAGRVHDGQLPAAQHRRRRLGRHHPRPRGPLNAVRRGRGAARAKGALGCVEREN